MSLAVREKRVSPMLLFVCENLEIFDVIVTFGFGGTGSSAVHEVCYLQQRSGPFPKFNSQGLCRDLLDF